MKKVLNVTLLLLFIFIALGSTSCDKASKDKVIYTAAGPNRDEMTLTDYIDASDTLDSSRYEINWLLIYGLGDFGIIIEHVDVNTTRPVSIINTKFDDLDSHGNAIYDFWISIYDAETHERVELSIREIITDRNEGIFSEFQSSNQTVISKKAITFPGSPSDPAVGFIVGAFYSDVPTVQCQVKITYKGLNTTLSFKLKSTVPRP